VLNASGQGTASAVASAFDLAGRLGIPVVNASLGSSGLSTAQRTAINAHPDTLYVVAAGNDAHDDDSTPTYPCVIPAANIVCVGATDNRDTRASFSNVGRTSVDLFAPGVSILSTYGTDYGYMNGTSMATPHVAGTLALMRQATPTLNAAQLKQGVLDGADRVPALGGLSVTGGRLNAANAIQAVRSLAGLAPLVATEPIALDPAPAPTSAPAPAPTVLAPEPSPTPPTPTPTPAPAPTHRTPVHKAPRLSGLVAAPATAIVCRPGASGCRAHAAQLRYHADHAATVTAQIQRRTCADGHCAYRRAATVTLTAKAGTNRLTIGARGATARLAAGSYRVRLVAADSGRHSTPIAHEVTVKRT
jgi:hypothetical protein